MFSQALPKLMIDCLKYGNSVNNPVVCCCFAQYKMGNGLAPFYINSSKTDSLYKNTPDTSKIRLKIFLVHLNRLLIEFRNDTRLNSINTVVIPGYTGCDCGGGAWAFSRN